MTSLGGSICHFTNENTLYYDLNRLTAGHDYIIFHIFH